MDDATQSEVVLREVRPGDRVTFKRPGVPEYGGTVWRSQAGGLWAGDTALMLRGEWLPAPSGDVTVTIEWRG